MAGLKPGLLDREIVLQQATLSQDSEGAEVVTWADDETIWAEWLAGSTRERWQAQQRIGSYIDGVYRVYYREDILPETTRIVGHDGRTYDVKGVTEISRREGLEVAVVAHGESPT